MGGGWDGPKLYQPGYLPHMSGGAGDAPPPTYMSALLSPVVHQMVKKFACPTFWWYGWKLARIYVGFPGISFEIKPYEAGGWYMQITTFWGCHAHNFEGWTQIDEKGQTGKFDVPRGNCQIWGKIWHRWNIKTPKKWSEVNMATTGKITSRQLREFQVNFLACADEVKDATPQEVRRLAMQKLPPFMKTWVIDAEQKRNEKVL